MNQIDKKEVADKLQRLYNSLLSFSGNANKNSKGDWTPVVKHFWAGKSESYATSASLVAGVAQALGISIEANPPAKIENDQYIPECCTGKLDEHEMAYHEQY